jgi:drug/metabolite transporter (DMT)-like permease
VFWGASFIATKIALRDVMPITVVWLRFGMGVLILGGAVVARKEFARFSLVELAYFSLLGFLGITFHQWLQSNGLVTSQATTSAWIVATTPVFIALLGRLLLKELLGWTRLTGIAFAAVGVLLVVTRGDLTPLSVGEFGRPGDVLILISAMNWAVFSILSRRELKRHPATLMMFCVMAFGWIFTSLLFSSGPGFADIGHLSPTGWLGVGFLGIFCSGLAYIFWYDALKQIPASQVGVFLYLEPLVTVVVAGLVLQENVVAATAVGGGIILLGVWLVNRQTRELDVVLE